MKAPPLVEKGPDTSVFRSYERLVDALHYVRQSCPTVPVLSIMWMHAKHPIHRTQEILMRNGPAGPLPQNSTMPGFRGLLKQMLESNSRLLRFMVCAANAARLSVKVALLRRHMSRQIAEIRRRRFDIVAKTWCFGLKQPSGKNDFYFGDLQQRVADRGCRMLLLCGDSSETDWHAFADAQMAISDSNRFPELCLVPVSAPLKMLWMQLTSSQSLQRTAANAPDPLAQAVAHTASLDVFSPDVTQNGLFFWIGKEVVRTWKPRAVVTLYEAHGWEKCLWWGARTEDRSCQIVGYQHTVVFPEALDLATPFVDIKERSVPDIVLALGERTRELIRAGHEKHGSRVMPFGTFRYTARHNAVVAPASRRQVLVIPEGLPFEIKALFQFARNCATLLPSYTFVLRCHPQWPIARALTDLGLNVLDLPNVVVSDKADIDEDYSTSSVVLYRGSSAVLYGVLAGLFPVYLHVDGKLDADPLYALQSWRRGCATPEEFAAIVSEHEQMAASRRQTEWETAASYVSEYATPVDERRIEAFLAEIGL